MGRGNVTRNALLSGSGRTIGRTLGHLLCLETDRDEQVPEALKRLAIKEIGGEINGEGGGIFAELSQQSSFIEARHQYDQVFNLLRRCAVNSATLTRAAYVPFTSVQACQRLRISSSLRMRSRAVD